MLNIKFLFWLDFNNYCRWLFSFERCALLPNLESLPFICFIWWFSLWDRFSTYPWLWVELCKYFSIVFLSCISGVYFSDMKRVPPHIRSFDLSYASMPLLCLESPDCTPSQGDQMTFLLCHPCQYSHNLYDISLEWWEWQRQRQRQRQNNILARWCHSFVTLKELMTNCVSSG